MTYLMPIIIVTTTVDLDHVKKRRLAHQVELVISPNAFLA